MDPSLSLLPVVWSQRSINFLKIQVRQDKSKPTRVAMIWLRVKVNRTRLCRTVHFERNEIEGQKSRENGLSCENIRFSSLFAAGDVSRGGTSATQRHKFHTDDANQCLHNESGCHGVPNINLPNFACLLVDFGEVLCSSANELQQD